MFGINVRMVTLYAAIIRTSIFRGNKNEASENIKETVG
jgi:hypothetical protein